jgi:ABC-type Mn2+/Zn2+ transport system ATPase subunit
MLEANNATLYLDYLDCLDFLDKKRILLSHITFSMQDGLLHYLHGPNGIGKTSLVKAMLGIDFTLDHFENKFQSFFYLPQVQNKEFLYPCRIADVSNKGNFLSNSERFVMWNNASGGQRKKALLERAFAAKCDLYVFDEPYNHLDQTAISELNKQLEKLVSSGKTVIMIGHKKPQITNSLLVSWDVSLWK